MDSAALAQALTQADNSIIASNVTTDTPSFSYDYNSLGGLEINTPIDNNYINWYQTQPSVQQTWPNISSITESSSDESSKIKDIKIEIELTLKSVDEDIDKIIALIKEKPGNTDIYNSPLQNLMGRKSALMAIKKKLEEE